MIGILLVTHSRLGDAMVEAAEFILVEKVEFVQSISIDLNESVEKLRNKILNGINKVNDDDGIIILTDMFGGTPSNLSYSFLEEGVVEVISGVNLPILIKAIKDRENILMRNFVNELEIFGKKSISLASGILRGDKRDKILN